MPLALQVLLAVLTITVIAAVAGYLIDKSAGKTEETAQHEKLENKRF